jgi:16S rRNA A1518/A1519 N6-dimethyltransferase RsmA/KsgA/DIM1 with predicted DNA glycosylase/AP lyase activity
MDRHQRSTLNNDEKDRLRKLVKHLFTQRRKQLGKVLRKAPAPFNTIDCTAVGIDPARRAETLSLPEWEALVKTCTP